MDIEQTIGWIVLIILMIFTSMGLSAVQNGLDDPGNRRMLYLNQLPTISKLSGNGVFHITIYRQSGNVHSAITLTGNASNALENAISTMRRAKIESVGVQTNTANAIRVTRLFHNHRGSSEGKRVGGFSIEKSN